MGLSCLLRSTGCLLQGCAVDDGKGACATCAMLAHCSAGRHGKAWGSRIGGVAIIRESHMRPDRMAKKLRSA